MLASNIFVAIHCIQHSQFCSDYLPREILILRIVGVLMSDNRTRRGNNYCSVIRRVLWRYRRQATTS